MRQKAFSRLVVLFLAKNIFIAGRVLTNKKKTPFSFENGTRKKIYEPDNTARNVKKYFFIQPIKR
jgi:hypothetical protein